MPTDLEDIKRVVTIQGDSGNWNYDPYMHGMYNGMELILSMLENREPQYRLAPDQWLVDMISKEGVTSE